MKRQYPVMLAGFLNFIGMDEGKTIEERCTALDGFASQIENRRMMEYNLMNYISFQEERIGRKGNQLRDFAQLHKGHKSFFHNE
ncbi:MAG: hypothetical protein WKF36_12255 [Candidatus Nitrosocosmicus sp.]